MTTLRASDGVNASELSSFEQYERVKQFLLINPCAGSSGGNTQGLSVFEMMSVAFSSLFLHPAIQGGVNRCLPTINKFEERKNDQL